MLKAVLSRLPGPPAPARRVLAGRTSGIGLALLGALCLASPAAELVAQEIQPVYVGRLIAGQGAYVEGSTTTVTGDGGLATAAGGSYIYGVAEDKYGNIYLADDTNCVIREVNAVTGIIETVAGTGKCGNNGDATLTPGQAATATELDGVGQLSFDNDGNLLFGDYSNQVVRKLVFSADGSYIVDVAGQLGASGDVPAYNAAPVAPLSARLHGPYGAAEDKYGNIFIADEANFQIRELSYASLCGTGSAPAACLGTVAGDGAENVTGSVPSYTNTPDAAPSAAGNALSVGIYTPYAVDVDAAGNVYWGNYNGSIASMYTPPSPNAPVSSIASNPGTVVYLAGTPGAGGHAYGACTSPSIPATSTSGCAVNSTLSSGRNLVSDMKGDVFVSDEADAIHEVTNGVMTTPVGVWDKADSQLSTTTSDTVAADYITATHIAPANAVYLDVPYLVEIDWFNNLLVSDTHAYQVMEATYNTRLPQTVVGKTSAAQTVYNQSSSAITLAAAAISNSSGEFTLGSLTGCAAGSALAAGANCEAGITFSPAYPGLRFGQLTFTDSSGNLSYVGLSGIGTAPQAAFSDATFTTIAGTSAGQLNAPRGGVADAAGDVYFADSGSHQIKRVDGRTGAMTVVAGTGAAGYSGDGGAALAAELNAPAKVAIDFSGNLFIADTGNNVIREVNASTGIITTVAGTGSQGYAGDNGLATAAELNQPQGLAVDPGGRVYVADTGNNVIRYLGVGGIITTIAGDGGGQAGYAGDGGPSGNSRLNAPAAITVDAWGDLFIADTGNDVIREIVSSTNNLAIFGDIRTIAGQQGQSANGGSGDVASQATLAAPSDVAVDAAGDVYIAAGGQVFAISAATGVLTTVAGAGAGPAYTGDGSPIAATVLPAPAAGIALDGAASLYVFETAANLVLKAPLASPAPVDLGFAAPGGVGAPQVVTVTNTGNSGLSVTGIATGTANFTIDGSPAGACSSSTSLVPGASCTVTVQLTPASTLGAASTSLSDTLTITDNSLNGTGGQTIALSGTARTPGEATTMTIATSPASPVYGTGYTVTAAMTPAAVAAAGAPTGTISIIVNGLPVAQDVPLPASGAVTVPLTAAQAGQVTVEASYSGDASYASSTATTVITVQPVQLTVTASNASISSGSAPPALTYTITGFVNGDTAATAVTGQPGESTAVTADTPAGSYPITITQGGLTAANYSFAFVNGVLTVTPPLLPAAGGLSLAPLYVISTAAGTGSDSLANQNSAATSAAIELTHSVATDSAGNIFLADTNGNVIQEVSALTGRMSIVAGEAGQAGYAGDGGPATSALLSGPYGVAVDNNGNLLISDSGNQCVRRVDMQTGIISLVAGTPGQHGYAGDGGPATGALLYNPYNAAADAAGNVYIAEYSNAVIRKVDTSGTISTFAGQGAPGYAGDGGPASAAYLYAPYGVNLDPAGNMLITEYDNHTVRRVNMKTGIISTIAGIGGDLAAYSKTPVPGQSCAVDSLGDGCPATQAAFDHPRVTVGDLAGNYYTVDEDNYLVRKVDQSGIMSIIGGNGTEAYLGDGGLGTSGEVTYVYGAALDIEGNLLVADPGNYRIRRLSLNAAAPRTAVGAASAAYPVYLSPGAAMTPAREQLDSPEFKLGTAGCPTGVPVTAGTPCVNPITFVPTAPGLQSSQLAYVDAAGNASTLGVYGIATAPVAAFFNQGGIHTIAGTGTAGSSGGEGSPAAAAQLNAPRGGVVDSRGFLYFADSANNIIRRVSPTGGILTVAGTGTAGYTGDGGAATAAQLNAPGKVAVDPAGNLYIADTGNNVIRFVDAATGQISTVAGTGTAGYSGDGGPAAAAQLNQPQGMAINLRGDVYVADTGNNAIRVFGRGGWINTVTGTGTAGYAGDGGNAFGAQLSAPQAVAVDLTGDVFIADTGNSVVREIAAPSNAISTFAGESGSSANAGDGGAARAATLSPPTDVALDTAGDLYIAAGGLVRQVNTAGVIDTIAGNGAPGSYQGEGGPATAATLPAPGMNLWVDTLGALYIADTAGDQLYKVDTGAPATLSFGEVTPGSSSAPLTVTVQNTGNVDYTAATQTPLTIGGIAVSAGFTIQTGTANACAAGTALNPGQSCTVSVVFSPAASDAGAAAGTLTITDNSLNGTGATQTVPLAGTASAVGATTTTVSAGASTLVYGTSTTVTAAVAGAGSTAPAGTIGFSVNGVGLGTVALNSAGAASMTLPASLPAGTAMITATYSGDAADGSSAATTSVTITPAVLTVTANNASFLTGVATAVPELAYTITGFLNGDTAASATSGQPTLATTATLTSPVGTYPITITQGSLAAADYTFNLVSGTLTINPTPAADFSLEVAPVTVNVAQASSASLAVTITPLYGYQGTVGLSCGSLPKNMVCTFNSSSATTDSAGDPVVTSVTLSTDGTAYVASPAGGAASLSGGSRPWPLLGLPLSLAGILIGGGRRRGRQWLAMLLLGAVTLLGLASCGQRLGSGVVAAGTYAITITATDAAAGTSHSAKVNVTVTAPAIAR